MKNGSLFIVLPVVLGLAGIVVVGGGGRIGQEATLSIERKPEDVFAWISEPERVARWQGDFVSSRPLTDGGLRVGARWRETVRRDGEELELEVEITELVWDERLELTRTGPDFQTRVLYVLTEEGSQTILRCTSRTTCEGFLARLTAPLTSIADRARRNESLARLETLLESGQ